MSNISIGIKNLAILYSDFLKSTDQPTKYTDQQEIWRPEVP